MQISISTGTFYDLDFRKSLELIRKAGFEYIELLMYWSGGDKWEMGQHLRGILPKEVLKMVEAAGLKISSLHDAGGTIEGDQMTSISRVVYEYLEFGDIPCVVLHTPHKKTDDVTWWADYCNLTGNEYAALLGKTMVCVENLYQFTNEFTVPLLNPVDLLEYAHKNEVYITADTTHFGQDKTDLVKAGQVLAERIRTVHLSDYSAGKCYHGFPGEGDLDLVGFLRLLDLDKLHAITLECKIEHGDIDDSRIIERMKQAYQFVCDALSK